jgi:DNA-binding MarR family transcriptional regulator
MTTPPAVFGQFGQTLAFAEQTLTVALREHLAQRGTQP